MTDIAKMNLNNSVYDLRDLRIITLSDNSTTTAGTWLAKSDYVTSYVDGQLYLYKVTVAGASTTTLNINSLGAKTIYVEEASNVTTQFSVGMYLLLVYNSTNDCFRVLNISTSDNLTTLPASVSATYTSRRTAGTTTVGGVRAQIESLHGNTVVWNQLMPNGNFVDTSDLEIPSFVTMSVADNKCTLTMTSETPTYQYSRRVGTSSTIPAITNHKYLFTATYTLSYNSLVSVGFGDLAASIIEQNVSANTKTTVNGILTFTESTARKLWVQVDRLKAAESGATAIIENVMCIDLTQMFGSGNEPSTVAEFKVLFPLDYYAYDAGSLLSFNGTGIKTVGFNLWDEQWENGRLSSAGNDESGNGIRSKNYIPVFPSTSYYEKLGTYTGGTSMIICYYDANKTFISREELYASSAFTTPLNCYFIRFSEYTSVAVTSYNYDICINISDSSRNGTYESYWESAHDLPISTYFDGGMKSALTIYDELTETKAIQRIGVVDLGSLTYTASSQVTNGWVALDATELADVDIIVPSTFISSKPNWVCPGDYTSVTGRYAQDNVGNWLVYRQSNAKGILISNQSWEGYTAAQVKSALNGVYMAYEKATPVTTDIDINLNYRIENGGTETVLPINSSTPETTPINCQVVYDLVGNTAERINLNYYNRTQVDEFVESKADKDGTYSELTSGNLTALEDSVDASYFSRAVPSTAGTGRAEFERLYGNTIAWNQLVQNGNFASTSSWTTSNASFSISNNVATITPNALYGEITQSLSMVEGHKYFVAYSINFLTTPSEAKNLLLLFSAGNSVKITVYAKSLVTGWQRREEIVNGDADVTSIKVKCLSYTEGVSAEVKNIMLFDLTQMFGSGNEPSTVAEFKALFPLDYYAYDAGSLLSFNGTGIQTIAADNSWTSTLSLPVSTYFTGGMKSAGSVYDELTETKAIKRIGSIDLGTLSWSRYTEYGTNPIFRAKIDDMIATIASYQRIACANLIVTDPSYLGDFSNTAENKRIATQLSATQNAILVRYDEYTNAASFKTAMSGVYLYYELATPVTTDIDINLNYRIENGGTETVLPVNASTPTTTNLVGKVVYDSIESSETTIPRMNLNYYDRTEADKLIADVGAEASEAVSTHNSSSSAHSSLFSAKEDAGKITISGTKYSVTKETWTFTLSDGTTVTKQVVII